MASSSHVGPREPAALGGPRGRVEREVRCSSAGLEADRAAQVGQPVAPLETFLQERAAQGARVDGRRALVIRAFRSSTTSLRVTGAFYLTFLPFSKRRSFNTPERREDLPSHAAKQALHNSMKDEPINKKLMELAEGRPRRSREKSVDSFQKKLVPKEKLDVKERVPPVEIKRSCLEEPLHTTTLHTESDLSDISDDPDDILNMEEDVNENKIHGKKLNDQDRDSASVKSQELSHFSPKPLSDDAVFAKDKETMDSYRCFLVSTHSFRTPFIFLSPYLSLRFSIQQ